MSHNYWLVGAMWGGKEDTLQSFLERGYWYCWDANTDFSDTSGPGNSIKSQQERFSQIKQYDRIAVKKIVSMTTQEMEIRAIGIVKDIDLSEWRVYIDWLPISQTSEEIGRRVSLKGCTASIHGPFNNNDAWVREIFCV
ncbi:MAG: hypothetical protein LBR95_07860 [Azoarcus sp.]|jgi:hypothetical protein|nr:hypothetical protein [Azoarcus sp.]